MASNDSKPYSKIWINKWQYNEVHLNLSWASFSLAVVTTDCAVTWEPIAPSLLVITGFWSSTSKVTCFWKKITASYGKLSKHIVIKFFHCLASMKLITLQPEQHRNLNCELIWSFSCLLYKMQNNLAFSSRVPEHNPKKAQINIPLLWIRFKMKKIKQWLTLLSLGNRK